MGLLSPKVSAEHYVNKWLDEQTIPTKLQGAVKDDTVIVYLERMVEYALTMQLLAINDPINGQSNDSVEARLNSLHNDKLRKFCVTVNNKKGKKSFMLKAENQSDALTKVLKEHSADGVHAPSDIVVSVRPVEGV